MEQTKELTEIMRALRLTETARAAPALIAEANKQQYSYADFLLQVFRYEQEQRAIKARIKRLKNANLPYERALDEFDLTVQPGISQRQLNELKSLTWVDQSYNLVLLGPTGVGKTFLSVGLCLQAIEKGYRAIFITMGELVKALKMETISRRSQILLKRLREAHLLVIDDLMFLALDKKEANLFFHFINDIYEETSIIITSNKGPQQWGELIGDEIIAAAILDRIVQKSEIIELTGDSYRVTHRQTIFDNPHRSVIGLSNCVQNP